MGHYERMGELIPVEEAFTPDGPPRPEGRFQFVGGARPSLQREVLMETREGKKNPKIMHESIRHTHSSPHTSALAKKDVDVEENLIDANDFSATDFDLISARKAATNQTSNATHTDELSLPD